MATVLQTSPSGLDFISALQSSVHDIAIRSPQLQALHDVRDSILRGLGQSLTWGNLVEEVANPTTNQRLPQSMIRRVEFDLSDDRGGVVVDLVAAPDDDDEYSW